MGIENDLYVSAEADRVLLTRPLTREFIGGESLPFGNDTRSSSIGAVNSSCIAFVFGETQWSVYYNGILTSGTVPVGLGAVNYDTVLLGAASSQTYMDIETVVVFAGSLTKSQLRQVEGWARRDAKRNVFWLGTFFSTLTHELSALTPGYTAANGAARYVEDALGGGYTLVNLTGSAAQSPWDVLNYWDADMDWRIKPGDVVVLWLADGAVDATYDPLIADRGPEAILQLREICRRVKLLGGIPVVPQVPPWGSFYEPYPSSGPWEKLTMLKEVNSYVAAHPTEFSVNAKGCPDLDLPELNPAVDNVTYYGGSTSEAMTDAGHRLVAPILAAAITAVAPVAAGASSSSTTAASLSKDYPNQGKYLIYADESTLSASGDVNAWAPREGATLAYNLGGSTIPGGTAISNWPLLSTQNGLAVGQRRAVHFTAEQSLGVTSNSFSALGAGANVAIAIEFDPLAATGSRYLALIRNSASTSVLALSTTTTITGGVVLQAAKSSGTYVLVNATELPLNAPAMVALVLIGGTMSIIAVSYAALVPDYWIVTLGTGDVSSVADLANVNTVVLNTFSGGDGLVASARRFAVWSPTNIGEVKNLLRFWGAKP
jgi:hypothetical protein